jgi:ABC-type molybdate transport system permease subunit
MRRGLLRRIRSAGFTVVHQEATGLPLDVLMNGGTGVGRRVLRMLDRLLVTLRPTLFGYQFICMSEPTTASAQRSN